MAQAHDLAQPFYDCIPQENRNKLDSKVDADHDGVQIHLGAISNAMDEWEGIVADSLGLTGVDVAIIKGRHRDNLSLQTRAALQKWQEKHGFQSTYRNLIVVFLKVGKTSYAEAVCRVLGGDPSLIRGTPNRMYASMPTNVTNTQGTRLRSDSHYHDIYYVLCPYANRWRDIGLALRFSQNELNIIQCNPMLMMQGQSGYLGEMLNKWLQWAPGDGRRSRNFATYEDLREALLKVPGIASVAYDLGPVLGIQGGTVPPPQPPSTNVHAAAHPYASMPAGMRGMSGYNQQVLGSLPPHSASVPASLNTPNYQQPPTLSSGLYTGSDVSQYSYQPSTLAPGVGFPGNPQSFTSLPTASLPKGGSKPLARGDTPLTMRKDHFEITRAINDMEVPDFIKLGQALGLSYPKLKRMTDMPADMVSAWLRQEDDVIGRTGDPTWRTLANALDSIDQLGIAKKIRKEQQIPMENLSPGPIPVSVEETTETDSELSEEQVCAQFMKKLEEWKIVKKDREKLEENGITSDEAWDTMSREDLKELKLTLGGRKILQRHLPESPSDQRTTFTRELSCEEDAFCAHFLETLVQNKIQKKDRKILQEHGITTGEVFKDLTRENLKQMKLTMGGRKLLEVCLSQLQSHQHDTLKTKTETKEQQQQPSTSAEFEHGTAEAKKMKQLNACSQQVINMPQRRVTHDHSDPGRSEVVIGSAQDPTHQLKDRADERVVTVVFTEPIQVPESWDPPETESDGPSTRTSYPPYPRVFTSKSDRTMKRKPKLKLNEDPKKLTTLDTWPIQSPPSLVGNYPMKSQFPAHGHGLALIINNENFDQPQHKQRKGSDRDEYNLIETFRFLGYRVEIRRDCEKEVIERLFDDMNASIKDEDDSFVCCILSHGSDNIIYGSDSEGVILRTAENSLEMKLAKCVMLKHKPKLFFVSTCRKPKPKPKEGDAGTREPESDSNEINPRADFAFNYATLPGEASWRYTDTGTFYISKLCQILCENATKATLSDIQKKVAQVVGGMEMHQLPTQEEQTTRNVYFFDDFF